MFPFQSDLPSGSEVIEVEEDNTINLGGEGFKILIDNGSQDSMEKRKGRLQGWSTHTRTCTRTYSNTFFFST